MPPSPPGVVRQRVMTAAAGLGVAALAAAAFALSYDDLRVLALVGGAAKRYAPVYPVMIDTLVVVTILSLVVARQTRWWARGVRWLLLLLLLTGAAAAGAQRAVKGYDPLPDKWLSAGVAVAPWALLLIAAWLWLSMFRQAKLLLGRSGAGARADAVPPSGTVRVVPTRSDAARPEDAEQLVPGLSVPAGTEPPQPRRPERHARPERPERTERSERAATAAPAPPQAQPPARPIVPAMLPTDIKLVTHRPATAAETAAGSSTETTQPDLVMPRRAADAAADAAAAENAARDADDAGIPAATAEATEVQPGREPGRGPEPETETAPETDDDDVERWSALAAEDAERWADEAADHFSGAPEPSQAPSVEWIPPASRFRSSPTPPRD